MINNSKKRIRHTFLHFACAFCLGNSQSHCQKGVKVVHSSKQFHLHNLPTSTTLNSRPSSYNGIVYDISRKWIFPAIFRPTESYPCSSHETIPLPSATSQILKDRRSLMKPLPLPLLYNFHVSENFETASQIVDE